VTVKSAKRYSAPLVPLLAQKLEQFPKEAGFPSLQAQKFELKEIASLGLVGTTS
jgi:hypothetical protein